MPIHRGAVNLEVMDTLRGQTMKTKFEILIPTNAYYCKSNIIKLFDDKVQTEIKATESVILYSAPVPLFSWDRRWYSKSNWTGINPFVFVSDIEITFIENSSVAKVKINRRRTIMYLLGGIAIESILICNAPAILSILAAAVLTAIIILIWLGSTTLIKNEIINSLRK